MLIQSAQTVLEDIWGREYGLGIFFIDTGAIVAYANPDNPWEAARIARHELIHYLVWILGYPDKPNCAQVHDDGWDRYTGGL